MIRVLTPPEAGELAPALAGLHLQAIRSGMALGWVEPVDVETLRPEWEAALRDEARVVLGAWLDGEVAGTVQVVPAKARNARHRGEIQRLAVAERRRGTGIGRALMERAEETARELGLRVLMLHTHDATPACAFYERLGWTKLGVVPEYSARPDGVLATGAFYYKLLG